MGQISRIDLIADLEARIHDCLKAYIRPDRPLAILDFPDIRNCGDSAIWLGEIAYLKNRFGIAPAYVSRLGDLSARALTRQAPEGPIFIHGGGNFGDIWYGHQVFREKVLEMFPDRQVIQFPQSIHFRKPERIEKAKRAIGSHGNFVLFVRDRESKDFAEKEFDCTVELCPDMAFAIGPLAERPTQVDVLAMLREDSEKVAREGGWPWPNIPREDWITEARGPVWGAKLGGAAAPLMAGRPAERRFRMLDAAANQRFERGIRQISRARAIVTDRLHVHICSLLLGRPHAVLDNSYGKIRRFMEAFSGGTDISYRAASLEDGVAWAQARASAA